MKLKQPDFQETILGAEKEMGFSIDGENSIIFEILRDKMYSNKIAAVCREVACNSRDANREAGRGDIPVEISIIVPDLTTLTDECIIFSDNGLGITPDRMENVFIKYGSSTKRDTNAQTGGFGLGAKTPFAYTDSFTIVTTCDWAEPIWEVVDVQGLDEEGNDVTEQKNMIVDYKKSKRMKFCYSAIIDKTGKGKMILFESEEVSKKIKTGTQVIIPIDPKDKYQFEQEVSKTASFWSIKPTLRGFGENSDPIEIIHHIEVDEDIIVDITENHKLLHVGYMACIDQILYPIDAHSCKLPEFKMDYPLIFHFEGGELTVSANREQLQYDTSTIAAVQKKLDLLKKYGKDLLKSFIDKETSPLKLKAFLTTLKHGKSIANLLRTQFEYSTQIFDKLRTLPNFIFQHFSFKVVRISWDASKYEYSDLPTEGLFKISETCDLITKPVYFLNVDERVHAHINNGILNGLEDGRREFIICKPTGSQYSITTASYYREADALVNFWQMDLHMYSDIEKSKTCGYLDRHKTTYYKKEAHVEFDIAEFTRSAFRQSRMTLDRVTGQIYKDFSNDMIYQPEELCFVVMDSLQDKALRGINCSWQSNSIKEKATTLFDAAKTAVILINKNTHKRYFGNTPYLTLDEAGKKYFSKAENVEAEINSRMHFRVKSVLDEFKLSDFCNDTLILFKLIPLDSKAMITQHVINYKPQSTKGNQFLQLSEEIRFECDVKIIGLKKQIKDHLDKNTTLVKFLNCINLSKHSMELIKELLNLYECQRLINQHKPKNRKSSRAFMLPKDKKRVSLLK